MKLIAQHTIHGAEVRDFPGPNGTTIKRRAGDKIVKPGEEFDSADHGMNDAEVQAMILTGAARQKTKEVPVDTVVIPVAENTAPRGPASGDTVLPDAEKVAETNKAPRGR